MTTVKTYGRKPGQDRGCENWENPKNRTKSKKYERQKGKKRITSDY